MNRIAIAFQRIKFHLGPADPRCILHIGDGDGGGNIRLFIDRMDKWDKVKAAKERSQLSLKSSKYDEMMINLPGVFVRSDGYHAACYKNFTAFSFQKENTTVPHKPKGNSFTRSTLQKKPTSPIGCLPSLCIFANKCRKKTKGSWENLGKNESNNAEMTIRETAAALNDSEMLVKIGNYMFGDGPDFVALEIKYHHSCQKS